MIRTSTHLEIHLPILDLNNTDLNLRLIPSGKRSLTSIWAAFGQPLWIGAAFVNELVPCVWLSSGALEVYSLLLRFRKFLSLSKRRVTEQKVSGIAWGGGRRGEGED